MFYTYIALAYYKSKQTSNELVSFNGYNNGTNSWADKITARLIPMTYIKYCVPCVYISAGVPRIKMADIKETRIDIAIGMSCICLPPMRNSLVVFCFHPFIAWNIPMPAEISSIAANKSQSQTSKSSLDRAILYFNKTLALKRTHANRKLLCYFLFTLNTQYTST